MIIEELSKKDIIFSNLKEIGKVMQDNADDVDKKGRFPHEAINAMKEFKLMGAYIPENLGGLGCNMRELVEIGKELGRYCAASAMIWAMHQIQLACLVHHGMHMDSIRDYLKRAAENQHLIASITSEVGVGGDIGRSIAGVEVTNQIGTLHKKASVISYGKYADSYLTTAKKSLDASETDQVLVLFESKDTVAEQTTVWDPMGMRGTCSPGFNIQATFPTDYILDTPFKDIAVQSMVPVTHILWASVWIGMARDAVSKAQKATKYKMKQNLKNGIQGTVNSQLVEVDNKLTLMINNLDICTDKYSGLINEINTDSRGLYALDFTLQLNNLKMVSSEMAVEIVQKSMYICGIVAYLNNTPYSLGRSFRDIMSSVVMIHNDRLYATNSSLLMLQK
ncbi:acyl-CoA dehydrogenase family protein [Bacillus cereus]|uniref:acyl-CoA dehydrogenase family protein n=1 Tax=Bacillus cereus TaxID=1396 RepID=UPI0034E8C0EE